MTIDDSQLQEFELNYVKEEMQSNLRRNFNYWNGMSNL